MTDEHIRLAGVTVRVRTIHGVRHFHAEDARRLLGYEGRRQILHRANVEVVEADGEQWLTLPSFEAAVRHRLIRKTLAPTTVERIDLVREEVAAGRHLARVEGPRSPLGPAPVATESQGRLDLVEEDRAGEEEATRLATAVRHPSTRSVLAELVADTLRPHAALLAMLGVLSQYGEALEPGFRAACAQATIKELRRSLAQARA